MNWKDTNEIAKAMQVTPSRVKKWKSQQSTPSLAERLMLGAFHDCDPDEFIKPKLIKMRKVGDLWKASVYGYKISFTKGMGAIDGKVFEGKKYHQEMEEYLRIACGQKIFIGVGL